MNLLMITGDRALAAGRRGAFYQTLEELHKHFDRIDVICPKAKAASYEMSVFNKVYVHPSRWPLVFQWLWIFRKGKQIIREHHSSVMTVHEYAPVFNGIGARWLHRATGVPYMLEIMHVPGVPRASGLWEYLVRGLTKILIAWDARPAQAVRVINKKETPEFLIAAGVPREKLAYIPAFYINLETFKPSDSQKQYDLIFVGRLARNKGVGLFLEIVRRAGLVALVVGDGPLKGWAQRCARRQRLKINFHGYAKDSAEIADLMSRSRLLAMTSLNEGGPRVVLEALACGVPAVATPVGIVPDILSTECIEEWNADDFAAKVKNLLTDQSLYDRVREAGMFTVQQFERKAAIKIYADAIKELAHA